MYDGRDGFAAMQPYCEYFWTCSHPKDPFLKLTRLRSVYIWRGGIVEPYNNPKEVERSLMKQGQTTGYLPLHIVPRMKPLHCLHPVSSYAFDRLVHRIHKVTCFLPNSEAQPWEASHIFIYLNQQNRQNVLKFCALSICRWEETLFVVVHSLSCISFV